MLEQKTIQAGMQLAQQWGPIGTIVMAYIIHQIFYARKVNEDAVKPSTENKKEIERLRDRYGELKDEYRSLETILEKKVTYEWLEKQLLPEFKSLTSQINRLESHFASEFGGNGHTGNFFKHINDVTMEIKKLNVNYQEIHQILIGTYAKPGLIERVNKLEEVKR